MFDVRTGGRQRRNGTRFAPPPAQLSIRSVMLSTLTVALGISFGRLPAVNKIGQGVAAFAPLNAVFGAERLSFVFNATPIGIFDTHHRLVG